MKTKLLFFTVSLIVIAATTKAQIKVTSGGKVSIGYAGTPTTDIRTHIVGNTLFSLSSSGSNGVMIRGNNNNTSANKPDYTWFSDSTAGIFHPASSVIGITIGGSEKFRFNNNGQILNSNISSPASTPDYSWTGETNTGLFHPGVNIIGFSISGSEKMRLTTTGLGIGNTPSYKLDVTGDINIPSSTSYGYRIGGNIVLTQRNITSSLFVGNGAGNSNTASNITAVGYKALYSNTSGTPNNAFGAYALYSNTTGTFNLAIGDSALYANTGSSNVAIGTNALLKNTTGTNNTVGGIKSASSNTTGVANTVFGFAGLYKNTTGSSNSAFGYEALFNTTGSQNSAVGSFALFNNTSAGSNTALGYNAMYYNTTGYGNAALGHSAFQNNTTGYYNVSVGVVSGVTSNTGTYNTFVGYAADANGSNYVNATAIGNGAVVTASNKIRVGNSSVTEIGGQVAWSTLSDGRFKTNVQENVQGLAFIKKLRPITYKVDAQALNNYLIQNYPDSIKLTHQFGMDFASASGVIHSGFIAQEVEQAALQVGYANSIVSVPTNENDVYALSYSELVVPLVKAMQEQSMQVDSLTTITHKLDSINRALQNQINDVITNCCQRKIAPSTVDRKFSTSTETVNETTNWLAQNKPNPFNKETVIEYNVIQEGKGSILIFDMNGKLLKTIPVKIPGKGSVTITANDLAAGMYYYTLVVNDNEVDTKKMILTQ